MNLSVAMSFWSLRVLFLFYATVFKKILLRLPLFNFEKELLTEINVAPAQLHSNS